MKLASTSGVAMAVAAVAALAFSSTTFAQSGSTLDKIISNKTLRCGVQLDFPPSGFRNAKNEADGFDVTYCKDMAAALGATAQIVETPSSERIPALVSNRIDVLVASTSITPQRALTVAFSRPYNAYGDIVLTRKDSGVKTFNDLKGRALGGVTGTTTEIALKGAVQRWNDPKGKFTSYGSEAEAFLALSQGKIDGVLQSDGVAEALVKSGQFPNFVIAGPAPTPKDVHGIAVRKSDADFLRWVDVFVWNQVRSGRYREVYRKYFGEAAEPPLSLPTSGLQY